MKFWVVDIANDYYLSLLTKPFDLEGQHKSYFHCFAGVTGSNLTEYQESKNGKLLSHIYIYLLRFPVLQVVEALGEAGDEASDVDEDVRPE